MRNQVFLALLTIMTSSLVWGASWEIDEAHSAAHFKIRHLTVSNVKGEITGLKGTFTIDDADVTKLVMDGTLDMKTINTSNAKRDEHLRAPDFFDTKKFPKASFKSKSVTKAEGDKLKVVGDFTMRGVTKELVIDGELTQAIKDPMGNMRRGFSGTTKINRKDFGVTYNKILDNGGLALGEEVDISLEIEVTQPIKAKKS